MFLVWLNVFAICDNKFQLMKNVFKETYLGVLFPSLVLCKGRVGLRPKWTTKVPGNSIMLLCKPTFIIHTRTRTSLFIINPETFTSMSYISNRSTELINKSSAQFANIYLRKKSRFRCPENNFLISIGHNVNCIRGDWG